MSYACVVVAELTEVYAGFGDREVKVRTVACDGVCVYRGGRGGRLGLRFGISRTEGLCCRCIMCVVWWKWWMGIGMLLAVCALGSDLVAS